MKLTILDEVPRPRRPLNPRVWQRLSQQFDTPVRKTIMSSINGSSEERDDSDYVPRFVYEVQPMRAEPGQENRVPQPVQRCKPEEATLWSVYRRRVEHVDKPLGAAEWLSDWHTQGAANLEVTRLRQQARTMQEILGVGSLNPFDK